MRLLDLLCQLVTRHPFRVTAFWLIAALGFGVLELAGPLDLTRLAAEGQAKLLPRDSESAHAADLIRRAWPDQAYETVAVAVLHRAEGLTDADRAYATRLADAINGPDKPKPILRVMGPRALPEIARQLISKDKTTQLVVAQLETNFVTPATFDTVGWLEDLTVKAVAPPAGLGLIWTGDAVFGRDYLIGVQHSLDRAALATVVLLLIVLLIVYRSLLLTLVPLVTIGIGFVIARGVLAGLALAGWAMSPLVELFLVVVLFGCGTDFCLFLSWRYGEHWNPANPGGAMRTTIRRAAGALLTSAGTVIAGLSLMGFTRFKLFSSTGPSVALGLALTVVATLTLTPALLLVIARFHPRSFAGLTRPSSGFWDRVGRAVLARPVTIWLLTVAGMVAVSLIGFQITYLQDLVAELPQETRTFAGVTVSRETPSVRGMRLISSKFGAGRIAPLTVLLESQGDLRQSAGLALIDDVSRLLGHQRSLLEVRSATQPLGSTEPLEPARLDARLRAINEGFNRLAAGADYLQKGLNQGAAKLRTAIMIEEATGFSLTGGGTPAADASNREALVSGLKQATGALFGTGTPKPEPAKPAEKEKPAENGKKDEPPAKKVEGPQELLLGQIGEAAAGAGQIADGARTALGQINEILNDPVGRHALNRLLVTPKNVREHPELSQSFAAYISPDGHVARIDLMQADRVFSPEALDQVETLRRKVREWLAELPDDAGGHRPVVAFTGPNAISADTRALTSDDQVLSWVIVPLGVFAILLITLRDPLACINLVATMVLTYLFALGVTHIVFITLLGAEGIDWKVPYFLFVLLVAVGVDYNVFLMSRLHEESAALGLRAGIVRAIAQTGGLISSAAAITACSFAALMFSPLSSLRQLGLALVVGITIDAILVRPVLVPCGQWLMTRGRDRRRRALATAAAAAPPPPARPTSLAHATD